MTMVGNASTRGFDLSPSEETLSTVALDAEEEQREPSLLSKDGERQFQLQMQLALNYHYAV